MVTPESASLDSKVTVNRPRQGTVTRRPLIEAARRSGGRVVTVTAPAGYGKSTMAAEWAHLETRRVAWASLDRHDDEAGSLLTVLAMACRSISPLAVEVVPKMRGTDVAVLGGAAPLLSAVIRQAPEPFVFFIDDLHAVGSDECQDALEVVLADLPAGSQLVLTSRYEQSFVTRRRLCGDLFEIGTDDLRVDADGARQIFSDSGIVVSDDDLASAVARSEGWPAGLFLYALTVRAGGDARSLFGDERTISDYLHLEAFARLPDDLKSFLRRTSILEELSAPVCDAVVGISNSSAHLRRLEELNLFLVPLDRRRLRIRYHPLFRDFLVAQAHRDEGEIVGELHLRAAEWFEANGHPHWAVDHLLAAGKSARAASLIAATAVPAYAQGDFTVISRWLSTIEDAVIRASPPLLVIATWTALLQGKSPGSERWAALLEDLDEDTVPDGDRAEFASARALVRAVMCRHGPRRAHEDAAFAAAYDREWSPWRATALYALGSTALLVGDRDAAADAFSRSSTCALEVGSATSVMLSESELALMAMEDGAWSQARARVDAAVRLVDENHLEGYALSAFVYAVAARVARHREDVSTAQGYLSRAMRARVDSTHVLPFVAIRLRVQLAQAFVDNGNRTAAAHVLREVDDILSRRPDMGGLVEDVQRFRTTLVDTVERVATVPLTPAELRLLPYLQTHLTLAAIGERLFISRNTVSSEVGSIYRKLGVTTRNAAVERALETGLLGH
ncbi:helix-turn-helix transcriptional regulator [Janibacter alittae]|uniref:LuxR C-terminal-related transcriptional regulator n=1 Tax=Janibacter alittae TaxID=3115209 RepID=A0ABZ2MEI2_9MICO